MAGAYYLQQRLPETRFVILEAEETFGGTWHTHNYPGIRSDSDLHTFGYSFKPWVGPPIATAEEILSYMGEVLDENDIERHVRYRHRIETADWSAADNVWRISAKKADGERAEFTANFLWMCQGYYRHREGYMPDWDGVADFKGTLVHSEEWPEGLDYSGQKVVVIGSGASAATIVPAMTDQAAHVTMLQRSPTFFRSGRNAIEIAEELRTLQVDETWIHEITRRKILYEQAVFTDLCRERPEVVKKQMIGELQKLLGDSCPVDPHFTPTYRPWRQRIAFVPDGDLFQGVVEGKASVVTDEIVRFVENGILLKSGEVLEADLIVASTGFNMSVMGDIDFSIDGAPLDWHETVTYRGMMFTGVPNLAWVLGYWRASWTLRSELVADFVCRLLDHMRSTGAASVVPDIPEAERGMALHDWIEDEDFNPAYLKRAAPFLPRRGESRQWRHTQDYWREKDELPKIDLAGEEFRYRWAENAVVAAE